MHLTELHRWKHAHTFGTDQLVAGERRTRWVVALTVTMMIVEVAAGMAFGSMALLADGWHMGTHAAALGIAVFAYVYARRHASDSRYSFGTGKVGALGGFGSAVGLAVVALLVVGESLSRLASPVTIRFNEAIAVAVVGLIVNLVSALLLGEHHDDHDHAHDAGSVHHHDHNLRGAYLHVLADALTSVLAIIALLAGKTLGWTWMDPVMGVVGGLLIARWSYGLLRDTSAVLLDGELQEERRREIQGALEADEDNRVADLHVWRVGPRHLAAIVSVVTARPRPPAHYKALLARHPDLVHLTIEVQPCEGGRPMGEIERCIADVDKRLSGNG
ncbi:MAG: CDF family Co(II)/Ni(II) efflux transporter DmeF [Myxococcaceae bacterium]